jgi:RNA polymerase sigma-70 factor (ECF subfamily)
MFTMEATLPTLSADEDAMRRVAAGDQDALAVLFDRHKERLFGYLCHLVGDASLAEDLLGETFLRVYRSRARYRAGSGFAPWLYAIARNLALGELRRRSTWLRIKQRLTWDAWTAPPGWDSERQEAQDRVRAALQALPEEQRSAVVLKEYMDWSYREIGEVLGCSEEAARARTYRARVALRQALKDWWETR